MKVLIVDDSTAMRMIVKKALRQAGYSGLDIVEASDGNEALKVIEESSPDAVLCDWNMPNMSGIELLGNLNDKGLSVKFGFITTEATDKMKQEALDKGSAFFLTKPFTPEAFEEAMGKVLS